MRAPAVAGSFYPADPEILEQTVAGLIADATPPGLAVELTILIVPHAGYHYSGPVAATGYALVPPKALRRPVGLVGPSHFVPVHGAALPIADTFTTPLGDVPIDQNLRSKLMQIPEFTQCPHCHAREHSLEVQLPFLQYLGRDLSILPVLTGDRASYAAAAIDIMVDEGSLVVVSSDLSHYLDHERAVAQDIATADAIVRLEPDRLAWKDACGRVGIQGALQVAKQRGWVCQQLDLRTSGDTSGDRSRVVGYGAFAIGPAR